MKISAKATRQNFSSGSGEERKSGHVWRRRFGVSETVFARMWLLTAFDNSFKVLLQVTVAFFTQFHDHFRKKTGACDKMMDFLFGPGDAPAEEAHAQSVPKVNSDGLWQAAMRLKVTRRSLRRIVEDAPPVRNLG